MSTDYNTLAALMGDQGASSLLRGVDAFTKEDSRHSDRQLRETAANLRVLTDRLDNAAARKES